MTCRRFLALAMVGTLLLFSQALFAAQTIRIATGHWPPYLNEDLPDDGFLAEIIRESFANEGIEVKFSFLPWSRALAMAKTENYQASAVWSCTASRSLDFLYSARILPYQYVFYHRAGDDFDWESLATLRGEKIGLTQDYSYGETLSGAIESGLVSADVTTSDLANFKKLLLDRIDLFPMDPVVGEAMIRNQFASQASRLTFHPKPLRKAFYHLLFAKKSPDAPDLKRAFDQGLRTLRESGRYEAIIENALTENSSPIAAKILEEKLVNWEGESLPCPPPTGE
ncbi:transporter substrate-binding domain-containing protein [Marinobacter sp. 71-i]|uniref:Transporter substrate-binding domain-containing protein n=1 Tax=Marinobacter iranensis TaxID=2962607 RepID=A0ABT5Y9D3_9GAMM|nr:transporter substrate-binding domain-containing protein [Marinobacter iranensis]MDF0750176.1 transporter substrate-binding domain-containing protein [Marinobacter iranensis]